MGSLLRKAVRVARQEGLREFVRKSVKYLRWRTIWTYLSFSPPLPALPLSYGVADVSTTMYVASRPEYKRVSTVRERAVREDFLREVEDGDVVYDIGANIGTYAVLAGEKMDEGTVVCFEPEPRNVEHLSRNTRSCSAAVDIRQMALADENEEIELAVVKDDYGGGVHHIGRTDETTIRVDARSIDSLVSDGSIPPPDVVKIDVEGAEQLVLEGMEQTLQSEPCRAIYCEVHLPSDEDVHTSIEDFGGSVSELTGQLADAGYEITTLLERDRDRHLKATRDV